MSPLLEVSSLLWGSSEIIENDPCIDIVRNCTYLPYDGGRAWGIFDTNTGQIFRSATDYRESSQIILSHKNQIVETGSLKKKITENASDGTYIYGGYLNPHFGHFIVNSLPRLWAISRIKTPSTKIVFHGAGQPSGWFAIPFVAAIMGALGLRPSDFAIFLAPTRMNCLVIPHTSFREQHAAHRAYARLCKGIGDRLLYGRDVSQKGIAYYSKSRLTGGVGAIDNEIEIDNVLRDAGVNIIYPETLTLAEQIESMATHACIIGTAGSALHSSIFCGGKRIVCLNVTDTINTNFILIDKLAGNLASYYHPPALHVSAKRPGFLTSRYLPEAGSVAQELLQIARTPPLNGTVENGEPLTREVARNKLWSLFGSIKRRAI